MNNQFFKYLIISCYCITIISCGVKKSLKYTPEISTYSYSPTELIQINDSSFTSKKNYFFKNKFGHWELKVIGNPLEIGLETGLLTQKQYQYQENLFFGKIKEIIPSKFKQSLLIKFLRWYNRKIYKNVPNEYLTEIYGVSKYANDSLSWVAPNFVRNLYLHGAHDIGHALQDLALVGCSSLAIKNSMSANGEIIVGRNLDFYAGDDFSKNKIISFIKPEQGYSYASISWAGMVGVVSGMNTEGITVTINAGKSDMPLSAKTPISLLTKEIVQYANSIDKAIEIAKSRDVFVSESILVSSAKENRIVIIEKSPSNFGVYENNSDITICTNHFQSDSFKNDKKNITHQFESHSNYRYLKIEELLKNNDKIDVQKMIAILRDKSGLNNKSIGLGNEKALNQLLAHHAVVFLPNQLKMFVSTNPYQLGKFICYDLNQIFSQENPNELITRNYNYLEEDPFLYSQEFVNYEKYRKLESEIEKDLELKKIIPEDKLNNLISFNPDYWKAYFLVGKYYFNQKNYEKAIEYFNLAHSKEVTTIPDIKSIEKLTAKAQKKIE